ncbi:hypothetical protein ACFVU3_13980 [Streptomyces sp. NPDC058052]|uniref:hypothetical protein n=1 Tax=Streptomyces sp. NPDC058052 TaxID=3346316 RepID=UPI0036E1E13A
MDSTTEPELPDPVPATQDAVTPDLPPPDREAPDIRGTGAERPRTEEHDGADASDASGTADTPGEDRTTGEPHEDADARGDDRPGAGPGTPAPQEQPG